ncbi:MAG: cytochrome c3 family protein, partial [Myxococcota bacterium]|nr:cytochrome c3 family protein [Myxococcota bacterium]
MSETIFLETGLVLAVAFFGAWWLPRGRWRVLWCGASVGVSVLMVATFEPSMAVQLAKFRPDDLTAASNAEYSSSRACRACHPSQYDSWHRSYHRTMTQPASPAAVLAPFDGRTLTASERKYRVFEVDGTHYVDMPAFGTAGRRHVDRIIQPVVMTTGSHHMQAYWIPVPWFGERTAPEARLAFNRVCAHCHGEDGLGGAVLSIIDADLGRETVLSAMATADHGTLDRASSDYDLAMTYTLANQYAGRLAQFPFVYLVKAQRWAHEEYTFMQPPEDESHHEPFGDRWSKGCDQCHSVSAQFDWRPGEQRNGAAAVAELGIACEACHGPGRKHIARHQNPIARYAGHLSDASNDDIVNPDNLDPKRASHICAQCHAELVVKDDAPDFRPGQSIDEFAHVLEYRPASPPPWLAKAIREEPDVLRDAFWRDGTIRVAGRDYNGMVKTGCFTEGSMSCMSCHTMHGGDPNDQLKPSAIGDGACTECHPEQAQAGSAHTHHAADSAGSLCYNCHMPHTTVGLLGLMRSHRIDRPSAQRTAWTGRPNACNLCHLDFTLAETAKHLKRWYDLDEKVSDNLDLGASAAIAWILRGDAVQRAASAWHMAWAPAKRASGSTWQPRYLIELLDDPYAA